MARAIQQNTSIEVVNCSTTKLRPVGYGERKFKEADTDVIFLERMDEVVIWYKYVISNFPFSISIYFLVAKGYYLNQ